MAVRGFSSTSATRAARTALALSILLGSPPLLPAQTPLRAPGPVLLKRLGEAVDGHRTGVPVYVVASYDPPNLVAGVFETRAEAQALVKRLGDSFDVLGPFVAPNDLGAKAFVLGCEHDGVMSVWKRYCPSPIERLADVDSVTIIVKLKGGRVLTHPIPTSVDAIFFTLPAIDKFVIPYYARILGVGEAAAMRDHIVRAIVQP